MGSECDYAQERSILPHEQYTIIAHSSVKRRQSVITSSDSPHRSQFKSTLICIAGRVDVGITKQHTYQHNIISTHTQQQSIRVSIWDTRTHTHTNSSHSSMVHTSTIVQHSIHLTQKSETPSTSTAFRPVTSTAISKQRRMNQELTDQEYTRMYSTRAEDEDQRSECVKSKRDAAVAMERKISLPAQQQQQQQHHVSHHDSAGVSPPVPTESVSPSDSTVTSSSTGTENGGEADADNGPLVSEGVTCDKQSESGSNTAQPEVCGKKSEISLTFHNRDHNVEIFQSRSPSSEPSQDVTNSGQRQTNPSPPPQQQQQPKKQKLNFACSNCRRAHKACSGGRPCERCIKLGIEDECRSTVRKKRVLTKKHWHSFLAQQLEQALLGKKQTVQQAPRPGYSAVKPTMTGHHHHHHHQHHQPVVASTQHHPPLSLQPQRLSPVNNGEVKNTHMPHLSQPQPQPGELLPPLPPHQHQYSHPQHHNHQLPSQSPAHHHQSHALPLVSMTSLPLAPAHQYSPRFHHSQYAPISAMHQHSPYVGHHTSPQVSPRSVYLVSPTQSPRYYYHHQPQPQPQPPQPIHHHHQPQQPIMHYGIQDPNTSPYISPHISPRSATSSSSGSPPPQVPALPNISTLLQDMHIQESQRPQHHHPHPHQQQQMGMSYHAPPPAFIAAPPHADLTSTRRHSQ